jgi:hypothetical protein
MGNGVCTIKKRNLIGFSTIPDTSTAHSKKDFLTLENCRIVVKILADVDELARFKRHICDQYRQENFEMKSWKVTFSSSKSIDHHLTRLGYQKYVT